MSEVDTRGKELVEFKKPTGPREQCQFVPEYSEGAQRSPGFLSLMMDLIESVDSSDSESDRSCVSSRRLSTRGWMRRGAGTSGMVALRSTGWMSSLGGGSEVGGGDSGDMLAAGCAVEV